MLGPTTPSLFTFDIFGTVVDWRSGLQTDVPELRDFDAVIDLQAKLEREDPSRPYREIVARSLEAQGVPAARAREVGTNVGRWPLFPDARDGMKRLQAIAPCVAMTNSDRAHGRQVQDQLGFELSGWLCAEETRIYKPDPAFWELVARVRTVAPGPAWWHVSAYADFDLDVATRLGLTTVFVERPHSRSGKATHRVRDLGELAEQLR
jgi:2-haloalkanoic acid dehalogenase type II